MWVPLAAAGIGAVGSIASSWLNKPEPPKPQIPSTTPPPQFTPKETKIQRKKRHLIDDLLYSLKNADGEFSDLYQPSEEGFQKSYIEPAMARFKNFTAPAIQQRFINMGMEGGTQMQDALTRAGVDMDQLLNQEYMRYYQGLQDRKMNTFNQILGADSGPQPQNIPQPQQPQQDYSTGSAIKQGLGGYLASDGFSKNIEDLLNSFKSTDNQTRAGFDS